MFYVLFNSDGGVKGCYIAGMHPNIPDGTEEVTKEDFDKYCTHQFFKGSDGNPTPIPAVTEPQSPQIITPPVDQDVADLWQAMLTMSAELEALKGGN